MNLKEIKEMLNLMSENNLTELEIEKEGMRIRLKKGSGAFESQPPSIVIERNQPHPQSAHQEKPAELKNDKIIEIKAPMVGTFYRAPSPEAPAYTDKGQIIEPGQVICIVEAMKLMNEIKSEIKGKVIEVLVENAEPIEFGQPLFLIEPL